MEYVKRGSVFIAIIVGITVWGIFTFMKEKDAVVDEEHHDLFRMMEEAPEEVDEQVEEMGENVMIIDIKGEVKKPGVYEVKRDDRVIDVITLAGGLTDLADERQINLAQKLEDEMVIYVPKEGEEDVEIAAISSMQTKMTQADGEELIRLNEASSEELQTLQGIGPAKAEAIIQYRDEHGPFQHVEDLLNVSGIGEKTLENIKDEIAIP